MLNVVMLLVLVFILMQVQPNQAGRVLDMEKQLWLQSLDRGPVPPSGPSGCTYIPGTGGTNCPVDQMNVAGKALRRHGHGAAAALVVQFGMATYADNQH